MLDILEVRFPRCSEYGILCETTAASIIPDSFMISRDQCLAVLRGVALPEIDDVRGDDDEYVLTCRGELVARMLNSAWLKAGKHTGLEKLRAHDPKHSRERQLRAAGVSFEDRQELPDHLQAA